MANRLQPPRFGMLIPTHRMGKRYHKKYKTRLCSKNIIDIWLLVYTVAVPEVVSFPAVRQRYECAGEVEGLCFQAKGLPPPVFVLPGAYRCNPSPPVEWPCVREGSGVASKARQVISRSDLPINRKASGGTVLAWRYAGARPLDGDARGRAWCPVPVFCPDRIGPLGAGWNPAHVYGCGRMRCLPTGSRSELW